MFPDFNYLSEMFSANGFDLTDRQFEQLDIYADVLVDWNGRMNLTGITDADGIAVKHFLDSLLPLKYLDIPENAALIDVGTGAGFPGLPIKIYRPDIRLTLLDSLNKRVNFLSEVCKAADISAECVHLRAEEGGRDKKYREKYDVAAARAVAAMPLLAEYCLPFVKVGGTFAALKGPNENYKDGENAVKTLGGEIADVREYALPNGDRRVLITVKKVAPTEEKYPRNSGRMAKKPIQK